MKLKSSIFIFLSIAVFSGEAFSGGWTQTAGGGFHKIGFRYLKADRVYNNSGIKLDIPVLTDITFDYFGEYGLTDDFTIIASAQLFNSIKIDTSSSGLFENEVKGFGDIKIGGRFAIARINSTIISASIYLNFPSGKSEQDGALWIGSGNFNQAVGIEIGHSYYPLPVYVNINLYFQNQTEGFSDRMIYGVEGGYSFSDKITLVGKVHGAYSLKNGNEKVLGGFGTYANNQQYLAYGAELVYKPTNNLGLSAYYESGTAGRNIVSTPVLSFGIFFTH